MTNFSARFDDHWLLGGARTPMVDYCGALAEVSPIDLGIKAARAALARTGVPGTAIDSVVTASMAQASFDAYMLPRHIGLYAGVPIEVPAIQVQRICGSGFEIIRQAADQITLGYASLALVVGAESMSRNPICAYTHRGGFKLGAPVDFKDFLWEALDDPAAKVSMIQTAENLAKQYGITRAEVDAYAAASFERALRAQAEGFFTDEITPVSSERFELANYEPRGIKLPRKIAVADRDTHPRPSPLEALSALRTVYEGGVQTAGNSAALVDGAAAVVVASGAQVRDRGLRPLARLRGAAAAGVPPEIMGIGPVPATAKALKRAGLALDDIDIIEINEAFAAQALACLKETGMKNERINLDGGAIALGHPMGATGARITGKAAALLRREGKKYALATQCIGGGQGIATVLEAI